MITGDSPEFLSTIAGAAIASKKDGGDSAVGAAAAAADDDTNVDLIGRSWIRNINTRN